MDAARIADAYARALKSNGGGPGRTSAIVRGGDSGNYPAQIFVSDWIPEDMAGAVEQGRRTAIVDAASLATSGFPLPIRPKLDRIVYGSPPKSSAITSVEERWFNDVLVAYELKIEGA